MGAGRVRVQYKNCKECIPKLIKCYYRFKHEKILKGDVDFHHESCDIYFVFSEGIDAVRFVFHRDLKSCPPIPEHLIETWDLSRAFCCFYDASRAD